MRLQASHVARARSLCTAVAAALCCAGAFVQPNRVCAADESRPPIVQRAVRTYTSDMQGVIGFRAHLVSIAHAAGRVTHVDVVEGLLFVNGVPAAAKLYRATSDGSDAPALATEKLQEALNRKVAAPPRSPLLEASAAEYRYEIVPCGDCEAGVVQVKFTSLARDARHADGTLWVEQATAHVVKSRSKPAALTPPLTSSETSTVYGTTIAGAWGVVRSEDRTSAKVFIMNVSSQTTETAERYRRFATVEDGRKAVEDETL